MLPGAISLKKSGNYILHFSFVILLVLLALLSASCSRQVSITSSAQAIECVPVMQEHRLAKMCLPQVQPVADQPVAFHTAKSLHIALNKIHFKKNSSLAITTPSTKTNILPIPTGRLYSSSLKQVNKTKWWGKNGILSYILLIITLIIILSLVVFFLTSLGGISGFLAFAIGGGVGIAMVIIYMATHPVG